MSPDTLVREIGGGLGAVAIVALGLFVVWLLRRNEQIQDGRLNDLREANKAHADLYREMNRTLDSLTSALRERG